MVTYNTIITIITINTIIITTTTTTTTTTIIINSNSPNIDNSAAVLHEEYIKHEFIKKTTKNTLNIIH